MIAESLLMVYEKPEAEGRYICTAHTVSTQDLVEMLKRLYPDHGVPKKVKKMIKVALDLFFKSHPKHYV